MKARPKSVTPEGRPFAKKPVGTLTAAGRYWRDVLSPRTRCVKTTTAGNRVTVANAGPRAFEALPLEIDLGGGKRHLRLVDVGANAAAELEV